MRLLLCLLVAAALLSRAAPASAEEKILGFDSDIAVAADGTLEVTESIRVRAEGNRIKRGIFRDFPTSYADQQGRRVTVGFNLLGAQRDGQTEQTRTEPRGDSVRIYLGRADYLLPQGEYQYRIRYRTTRQIGFYDDHDELYWNVTGNGWDFPIDLASASVTLPPGGEAGKFSPEAYVGFQGDKGRPSDWTAAMGESGQWTFQVTRVLAPREGLTIVLSFPKGLVTPPQPGEPASTPAASVSSTASSAPAASAPARRPRALGAESLATGALALLLLLAVGGYYLIAWRALGRDPDPRAIFPRYNPPIGFSPGELRYYFRGMIYDSKCLSADLMALAAQGLIRITSCARGEWELEYKAPAKPGTAASEASLLKNLFNGRASVILGGEYSRPLESAAKAQEWSAQACFGKEYFSGNGRAVSGGLLISALALTVASWDAGMFGPATVLTGILALVVWFGGVIGARGLLQSAPRLRRQGKPIQALLLAALSLAWMAASLGLPLPWFAELLQSQLWALFTIAVVAVGAVFSQLLKAFTPKGQVLTEEMLGFRLYLSVAEQKDIAREQGPPPLTQQRYNALLPFAMALDVEDAWTSRLNDAVARGLVPPAPPMTDRNSVEFFRLGGKLASAIEVGVRRPQSSSSSSGSSIFNSSSRSSGSSGRGSSGGGGGGGGGGGW